jgi:glycosyltransferase involved in cell wall biosynthesis
MHTLVEAMPLILRSYPDARCVIVGGAHKLEPDYPAFLADAIRRSGAEDRVIRAGYQSNPELWMQAMDVMVHAASQEPFGLVVLEAMSLRKPIVAGDSGGPREIITDGVDGILFPPGDAGALARAILAYLDDAAFAQRISTAGRRRALDFTTQRYAATLVAAMHQLTGAAP